MSTILTVSDLSKKYKIPKGFFGHMYIEAVKSFSFKLDAGKTLAIIGKNGSGKSTLAKMLVGMEKPDEGDIWIENKKLEYGDYDVRHKLIRMIFQNVDSSFDPRLKVGEILDIPLKKHSNLMPEQRQEAIIKALKQVGLSREHANYYPKLMAAGQKQRVALARALILNPKVIIFDEPFTALDISMRSQIVNLILSLQKEQQISYIFVTQDIGMMKHISDDILVMDEGKIIEYGNTHEVLFNPQNKITKILVQSYFGHALSAQ